MYLLAVPRILPNSERQKPNPFTPFCGHYYLSPGYKCAVSSPGEAQRANFRRVCDFYDHVHVAHPPQIISARLNIL